MPVIWTFAKIKVQAAIFPLKIELPAVLRYNPRKDEHKVERRFTAVAKLNLAPDMLAEAGETGKFMKTKILLGLCVALSATFISACASHHSHPAASGAAVEQKGYDLDQLQAQSVDKNSMAAVPTSGESNASAAPHYQKEQDPGTTSEP